ncbi:19624_t:CDS:2 [Racocetra fulgida]|uniref:19624_t:CDS:1 n=1 Tax=Racocetra fulgida TaxID=60492 RepID=A0A9N9C4M4_9GLOM|nr:19624_t:CDS:2 [Racocetra fulgida]
MSFNKNLQNFAPTSDTLPRLDENFVIKLSTDSNNEPNAEKQFFKHAVEYYGAHDEKK